MQRDAQKVEGRLAVNRLRDLTRRWGSGKRSFGARSCLMLARRTSDVFSISATRMIYRVSTSTSVTGRTWIERKRARCRAAMSWYSAWTASARESSRNSLYMLWLSE